MLRKCFIIWAAICIMILVGEAVLYKTTGFDLAVRHFDLFFVPAAVPLPLAIYLNRNKNRSAPQPTSANAS